MAGEAQRTVNVIRSIIDDSTGNAARMNYTPGVVEESFGSGYLASVYVRVEDFIDEVDVPDGMNVAAGDYVMVAETGTGEAWISYILPQSLYSRLALDFERQQILTGDGSAPPTATWAFDGSSNMVPTGDLARNVGSGGARVNQVWAGALLADRDDATPSMYLRHNRATGGIPNGTGIGNIRFESDDGTTENQLGATIWGVAAETWTAGAHGAEVRVYTTDIGSDVNSPRWVFDAGGALRPYTDAAVDIGSASKRVKDIHVSGEIPGFLNNVDLTGQADGDVIRRVSGVYTPVKPLYSIADPDVGKSYVGKGPAPQIVALYWQTISISAATYVDHGNWRSGDTIVIPSTGTYAVSIIGNWEGDPGGVWRIHALYVNGANLADDRSIVNSYDEALTSTFVIRLTAGDVLTFVEYQDSRTMYYYSKRVSVTKVAPA